MTDTGLRGRKKQQTRAALIDAALRLVDERGLDGVTVEDISAAAEVSPRTFFNYFATKDEPLLGDDFGDKAQLLATFRAVEPGVPVIGALLLAIAPVIAEMQAQQDIWFRRTKVIAANPSLVTALIARGARSERELVLAIAERVGVHPDSGFPLLMTSVFSATFRTALIRWALSGGARTLSDYAQEAFGMVAAGLPDPVSPEESRKVK